MCCVRKTFPRTPLLTVLPPFHENQTHFSEMSSVGRTPRKNSSVRMVVQSPEEAPPPAVQVTIPKVPLTKKSKQKEPLALIRRKMLVQNQEIQEIQILGCREDPFPDSPPLAPSPVKLEPGVKEGLYPRFQGNEVATQTPPVYCFSSLDEIVEFMSCCNKNEEGRSPPLPEGPPDEPGKGGHEVLSDNDHSPTLKLGIEEDDEDQPIVSHNPPVHYVSSSGSPCFPVVKRRRKQRFHCDWQGPVTIISSPNVPANAVELRVGEDLAMSIRRQVDVNNPGPFGWQLAKLLFTEEELYGHNFNGTDQKMPLSPRRVHAIQHAFHDYFPKDMADEALARGRTAINQGIRNMFYVRSRRDGDYA
ncbi:hypothetical protein XENTR_v10015434 [Xenopus tropicalis]|uniref:Uncharacterized protein LOC116411724 n=1 Tax=Xenopus tropicalis TaxID=8364 RepID=A0A8J1JR91_XENTR|nr:uncharacterized protein LOC116411724 [Xenopus tropicalis]KAE8595018.1 hypothetical protein XENTR_v10015434 [Xenopus tropicalis]